MDTDRLNRWLTLGANVAVLAGLVGCAAPTRYVIQNVNLGMTTHQVSELVGEPTILSDQEPYQAWRYEYRVLSKSECEHETGINPSPCVHVCVYQTVWFADSVVRSMTTSRVEGLQECGLGSVPIDWDQMPEYVNRPND